LKTVTSGDDTTLSVQLLDENGDAFVIDPGATVRAAIVNDARTTIIVAAVTCDNAATGADWSTSLVVVEFTALQTTPIASNATAWLEIEVADTVTTTYFERIKLQRGLIT
jgi:hypothetical protein